MTGSVSLGEVDSGGVAPLHHHTREQTDIALTGVFDVTIGDRIESLGPGVGVVIPADVPHSIANHRRGVATMLEFHTVRRPDLVPPRPTMTFPVAPAPAPTPTRALAVPMDVGDGATLTGETCTMRWRRVTRSVDVHPDPTMTELFVYVARGAVRLVGEAGGETLGAGTLIIVPARVRHVQIAPMGADAGLIEFRVVPR
jgi:mannose-6-phosphate isomerase-like protein (cupin superfamily)